MFNLIIILKNWYNKKDSQDAPLLVSSWHLQLTLSIKIINKKFLFIICKKKIFLFKT